MKRLILFIAFALTISAMAKSQTMQSARQAVSNMTIGWNLGNTLDAMGKRDKKCVTPEDWETSWGEPVTTREMIHTFKERGFNVIRIPVTWWPHLDEIDHINEAWLNRVNQVVDYVIQEGMYCILNVHHDTGTHGWLNSNPAKYPEISKRFKSLWIQIANRFKDYDDKLLFEGFNEMLDSKGTWDHTEVENYTAINLLAQDFVDVVRRTGGNNEYRNLIITTYSANAGEITLKNFRLPSDVHTGHLIGEIHFYDPQDFCFPEKTPTVYTDEYRNISKIVINRAADYFDSIDIPLIIGEIAAFDKKNTAERVKFSEFVASEAKKRGIVLVWWMGLLDREKCKWSEPEVVDALFNGLKKGKK